MRISVKKPRFEPGTVMITSKARETLPHTEINAAVKRHLSGDWGDLDNQDKLLNEDALKNGGSLLSVYHTECGVMFWIMTEASRSVTTIMLPNDCGGRRTA